MEIGADILSRNYGIFVGVFIGLFSLVWWWVSGKG